jgi:hypothetical protein
LILLILSLIFLIELLLILFVVLPLVLFLILLAERGRSAVTLRRTAIRFRRRARAFGTVGFALKPSFVLRRSAVRPLALELLFELRAFLGTSA